MTREEAIQILSDLQDGSGQTYEAIRMAIEAFQFAEHFDLLKEYESLQEVVRCKDCRWQEECLQFVVLHKFCGVYQEISFCSHGERREP